MTGFGFALLGCDLLARRGRLTTAHGTIETPAFMPVGTAATVKAMHPQAVADTGAEILLANTYHLMLRPGAERVAQLGGLHRFMAWPAPILTDSGGYQVMSLAKLREITEQGVLFRSQLDGSRHHLTPERSTSIQHLLDATITMAFDECTPFPASFEEAERSMHLSMRWAARSRSAFIARAGYGQFGIVQGGVYPELRQHSVASLLPLGFEGYAVGGLAVGEGQAQMLETLGVTLPLLPVAQPRYLMGVGRPEDLVAAVALGVDMFDCVLPTRSGRTAQAFTRRGAINLRNARHSADPRPIDPDCSCPACHDFSRGYLHHLFRAREMLGAMLLTQHNLTYYQTLMREMRGAIETQRFAPFMLEFARVQALGDIEAV